MNALASSRAAVLDLEAVAADYLAAALRRSCCSVRGQGVGASGLRHADVWQGTGHVLMCIRAAVAPGEPAALTADEARAFRLEAAQAHAQPWVACVVLHPNLELKRLDWRLLEAPHEATTGTGLGVGDERLR